MTNEEKYTVRKADGTILEPGSYVVIRSTDLLAYTGLYAYAHNIESLLEIDNNRPVLTPGERSFLRQWADRLTHLASSWQKAGLGRIPD